MSRKRSHARRRAVQALYQWQMAGGEMAEVERQFLAEQDMGGTEIAYFQRLIQETAARVGEIDAQIAPLLDRSLASVDPVECAILRLGAYELGHALDVPYRVVINEGVELAKRFGAEQGHKYINSVLDKLARDLRRVEIAR